MRVYGFGATISERFFYPPFFATGSHHSPGNTNFSPHPSATVHPSDLLAGAPSQGHSQFPRSPSSLLRVRRSGLLSRTFVFLGAPGSLPGRCCSSVVTRSGLSSYHHRRRVDGFVFTWDATEKQVDLFLNHDGPWFSSAGSQEHRERMVVSVDSMYQLPSTARIGEWHAVWWFRCRMQDCGRAGCWRLRHFGTEAGFVLDPLRAKCRPKLMAVLRPLLLLKDSRKFFELQKLETNGPLREPVFDAGPI